MTACTSATSSMLSGRDSGPGVGSPRSPERCCAEGWWREFLTQAVMTRDTLNSPSRSLYQPDVFRCFGSLVCMQFAFKTHRASAELQRDFHSEDRRPDRYLAIREPPRSLVAWNPTHLDGCDDPSPFIGILGGGGPSLRTPFRLRRAGVPTAFPIGIAAQHHPCRHRNNTERNWSTVRIVGP